MIGTEHLLLSILKENNNIASSLLMEFNMNYESVKDELELMMDSGYQSETLPESKTSESASENDDEK